MRGGLRHKTRKSEASAFATLINRQRTVPTLFLFSYITIRHNLRIMREFAGMVGRSSRILDAGCGFKPWLQFFHPDAQYIGVDYSAECSSADALASADFLPFQDDTFDAVICSEVLEHTRFPDRCISELRRVSKPGGLIYISTPFAFPEHGIPYDFQRPTQYYFREVFKADEIVCLNPTSTTLATAFTGFNFFVECTPLKMIWGFKHLVYLTCNVAAYLCDVLINHVVLRIKPGLSLYTHTLPLGFNMIIRVKKPVFQEPPELAKFSPISSL